MSELSNFELNKAIAEALGVKIPRASVIKSSPFLDIKDNVIISFFDDGSRYDELFPDYCNSWNDLMPLVVEYKINLEVLLGHKKHMWIAGNNTFYRRINANPQRALAECLLKVLQEKQGDE